MVEVVRWDGMIPGTRSRRCGCGVGLTLTLGRYRRPVVSGHRPSLFPLVFYTVLITSVPALLRLGRTFSSLV